MVVTIWTTTLFATVLWSLAYTGKQPYRHCCTRNRYSRRIFFVSFKRWHGTNEDWAPCSGNVDVTGLGRQRISTCLHFTCTVSNNRLDQCFFTDDVSVLLPSSGQLWLIKTVVACSASEVWVSKTHTLCWCLHKSVKFRSLLCEGLHEPPHMLMIIISSTNWFDAITSTLT